jgi:hypothetical protein
VAVFAAWWLGGDAALVVLWCVPPWLRGRRRRARLPVQYGPLPVPLASAPARYADAELLAVDAVLWSYAEAVGGAPWPAS